MTPTFSISPLDRKRGKVGSLGPMLRYVKPYSLGIFTAFVMMCITSGAVLGMGSGLRYLIDEGLSKGDSHLLNRSFGILIAVTLLLAGATYARFYLVTWIGERIVADIRRDVYQHLTRMHVGFFETTRTGEILSRLIADTTLIQTVIGSSLSVAVRNSLMLFGGVSLLLYTSVYLSTYLFVALPLVVIPIVIIGKRARAYGRDVQGKVADLSSQAEEMLSAIRTVQSFTLEAHQERKFEASIQSLLGAAQNRIRIRALLTAIVIMLVFGSIITVLWFGGHDVITGRISAGDLSAFVFYSVVVAGAVGSLSEVIADIQRAAGASERLSELLVVLPEINSPAQPHLLADEPVHIRFEQVSFSYPQRADKPVLHDITLALEPDTKVALVGPSGAGKTTVFQLLQRFYDPSAGRVLLNGVDIRELSLTQLRHLIGVVPQDATIFSGTVADNIRIGAIGASDADIKEAARKAAALGFIEHLPQGFATHVGEKGVQLSGGQRQRIAIARAILRDPKILLLDEATSALDAENEHDIQRAIENITPGRTTLIIAHRLATIIKADQIVLMNEGRIEAMGTHAELLKNSPLYARFAELQFANAKF